MTTLFNIELSINMPDGGRYARHLLNLYFDDMPGDINETVFNDLTRFLVSLYRHLNLPN